MTHHTQNTSGDDRVRYTLEISQVGNGFMVRPPIDFYRGEHQPLNAVMVFRTFAEMVSWLAEYFTHRADTVPLDTLR